MHSAPRVPVPRAPRPLSDTNRMSHRDNGGWLPGHAALEEVPSAHIPCPVPHPPTTRRAVSLSPTCVRAALVAGCPRSRDMVKLLVDGFTAEITGCTRSFVVLAYPSGSICPAQPCGTWPVRWLPASWRPGTVAQALGRPAGAAGPAHLRCVRTYTQLAAGFGVGAITVYRYIVEAVKILAVLAPDFMAASSAAKRKASSLIPSADCCEPHPHCLAQSAPSKRPAPTASAMPWPPRTSRAGRTMPIRELAERPEGADPRLRLALAGCLTEHQMPTVMR